MKKIYCAICGKYKIQNPDNIIHFPKNVISYYFCSKTIFKKEESIEILKTLSLFKNT